MALGNELTLEQELKRQAAAILRGRDPKEPETRGDDWVPRAEHERIVRRLNERIAGRNTRGRRAS